VAAQQTPELLAVAAYLAISVVKTISRTLVQAYSAGRTSRSRAASLEVLPRTTTLEVACSVAS
jgi:hypothetical protein